MNTSHDILVGSLKDPLFVYSTEETEVAAENCDKRQLQEYYNQGIELPFITVNRKITIAGKVIYDSSAGLTQNRKNLEDFFRQLENKFQIAIKKQKFDTEQLLLELDAVQSDVVDGQVFYEIVPGSERYNRVPVTLSKAHNYSETSKELKCDEKLAMRLLSDFFHWQRYVVAQLRKIVLEQPVVVKKSKGSNKREYQSKKRDRIKDFEPEKLPRMIQLLEDADIHLKHFKRESDLGDFCRFLNSIDYDSTIHWEGTITELLALCDGIEEETSDNKKFTHVKRQLKGKVTFIDGNGTLQSDLGKKRGNTYNPVQPPYKGLIQLGRDLAKIIFS